MAPEYPVGAEEQMPGCRLKPKMPLAALVECLWYWEGAPGPHLQERLLPQAQAAWAESRIAHIKESCDGASESDS